MRLLFSSDQTRKISSVYSRFISLSAYRLAQIIAFGMVFLINPWKHPYTPYIKVNQNVSYVEEKNYKMNTNNLPQKKMVIESLVKVSLGPWPTVVCVDRRTRNH